MARSGGRILFGSDTPSAPTYANPPGYNGYSSCASWSGGHLPQELLSAATAGNARFFGLADYGTIERGKIASLLILRSDPLASTAAFDAIETAIVKGRVVRREAFRRRSVDAIRIWLHVSDRDNYWPVGAKYQFVFARNAGHCDRSVKQQTLAEALEWVWKD